MPLNTASRIIGSNDQLPGLTTIYGDPERLHPDIDPLLGYGIIDDGRIRHCYYRELATLAGLPPNVGFESDAAVGNDTPNKRVGNAVWAAPAVELASAVVLVTEVIRERKMPTTQ